MGAGDTSNLPARLQALAELLFGRVEFTPDEVAAQSGVPREHTRQLWRAMGFPPAAEAQRQFTPADVAVLRGIGLPAGGGDLPRDVVQQTRVIGQALARVAEAQVAMAVHHDGPMGASGDAVDWITPAVVARLESVLAYAWRRHLFAAAVRRAASVSPGEGTEQVVGFADLVGFTALARTLSEQQLAAVIERFEGLIYENIPEHGGRIVKMIGDEVMFAVDDVSAAARIALALLEAQAAAKSLPRMRIGLAVGPVLSWGGDLFGPTVNLASRLVGLARPSTAVASAQLAERLRPIGTLVLRRLPPVVLKGIGHTTAYALRGAPRRSRRA